MVTENYLTIFDQRVACIFKGLLDNGYSYEGVNKIQDEPLMGTYLIASFLNTCISRKIEISYIPKRNKESREVVILHVDNLVDDTFSLGEYLVANSINKDSINMDENLEPFSCRLNQCLSNIEKVMTTNITSIITGQNWVHIPFNWGKYK